MGEVPRSVVEADVEVDEAEEVTEDMAHREEGQKSKVQVRSPPAVSVPRRWESKESLPHD